MDAIPIKRAGLFCSSRTFFALIVTCALVLAGCQSAPIAPAAPPQTSADALTAPEHVSPGGSYQTSFDIPVPPAPAAPRIVLNYDSQSGGSLAGIGWDLSVGWPMSIMRDLRFGTTACGGA